VSTVAPPVVKLLTLGHKDNISIWLFLLGILKENP
jgi:hypothetical protein